MNLKLGPSNTMHLDIAVVFLVRDEVSIFEDMSAFTSTIDHI
jgi:hypothetical protein